MKSSLVHIKKLVVGMYNIKNSQHDINNMVAKWMIENYTFKAIKGIKTIKLYVYKDGIYIDGESFVMETAEDILDKAKTNAINEIKNKICRKSFIDRRDFLKIDPKYVCIENGVLNLKNKTLLNHGPEHIFTEKLPLIFDKDAKCPLFEAFIEDVLDGDDIKGAQEWFGYMMWRDMFKKKALICMGPTNTGKTVFLNIIIRFLGLENISTTEFQNLVGDKFAGGTLYNKYANIDDELSSKSLYDLSKFKKLTGKSAHSCEKKFEDAFSFVSFAKIICATNKMPNPTGTLEDPESYYNRWLPLNFDNVKSEDEQDSQLENKICCEEELSGILNWALIGLIRLLRTDKFTNTRDWVQVKNIMKSHGDSVNGFEKDCITEDRDAFYTKNEMYGLYETYCKWNNKIPEKDKMMFGKKFNSEFSRHFTNAGKTGWKGGKVDITVFGF